MPWLVLLMLGSAFAAPKELEVWFLTPPRAGAFVAHWGPKLAQTCEQIGDYCLDPQRGLYRPDMPVAPVYDVWAARPVEEMPQLPTTGAVDRNLVSCDTKYAFDIFCGEARPDPVKAPPKEAAKVEVWIDTSSSMREMDQADGKNECGRLRFIHNFVRACPLGGKARLKVYDVSIRETTDLSSVCQTVGQNNTKRLMDWIDESQAPKLVVITDVNEYNKEFADFITARHGTVRGDQGSFTADKLAHLAEGLALSCK